MLDVPPGIHTAYTTALGIRGVQLVRMANGFHLHIGNDPRYILIRQRTSAPMIQAVLHGGLFLGWNTGVEVPDTDTAACAALVRAAAERLHNTMHEINQMTNTNLVKVGQSVHYEGRIVCCEPNITEIGVVVRGVRCVRLAMGQQVPGHEPATFLIDTRFLMPKHIVSGCRTDYFVRANTDQHVQMLADETAS